MNQEDIERNIAFIVDQQAKFFSDIEELKALGRRTDARLSRAIRLGIAEARQEREKRRDLAEKMDVLLNAQIRTEQALTRMADAITKTNQRIDVLENGNSSQP